MDGINSFEDLRLQGFNVDEGLTYTGNRDKYIAALQRFVLRAGKTKESLSNEIDREDYEALTTLVHALKGNARTIGAASLASVAESMELYGRMNEYDQMLSLKDDLFKEFDDTVSALKPYGEMEQIHPKAEISAKEAEETADALIEAIEDFDDAKAKELIDRLMRYPFRYTLINVLKNAREDIMDYEYTEALLKIRRVASQIED